MAHRTASRPDALRCVICFAHRLVMYVPPHFAETRPDVIRQLIEEFPLGSLVTNGSNGLDANVIPFELAEMAGGSGPLRGLLRGHIARANPLWQDVADGSDVLVVFRARDSYVSPNWYPSKHETHRLVPTWNYQVVNVHGRIRFIDDEKFLRAVVGRLTRAHERRAEGERGWRMADAPADYIASMLAAIVGVEIAFERVVAKSKLSQNREDRDRLAAADTLEMRGLAEMAQSMRGA